MLNVWCIKFLFSVVYACVLSCKNAECPFHGLFCDTLFATSWHVCDESTIRSSIKKKSFVELECVHHCVPTYCPYWYADPSKVRNSQSAIEMQEKWNNSPTRLSKCYNKMCSACKLAQMLAMKQNFEAIVDEGCHGLWSVVVVDGWYDMGYEITCRRNLGVKKTGIIAFLTKDNRCYSNNGSFCVKIARTTIVL